MHRCSDHFEGKSVVDHLKIARAKGALASAEIHGTEMPGHLAATADASKETTLALASLFIITHYFANASQTFLILTLFSCTWLIWKTGRSALLGWARMERLHRVIEEEKWEIEHHRQQEREELTELYRAKGLSGKLLSDVIDVLMADDDRLLKLMLEEELGLTLEAYEHPLKQSAGACIGVLISSALLLSSYWFFPTFGIPVIGFCILAASAAIAAHLEGNKRLSAVVWNVSIAILTLGTAYFIGKLF